MTHRRLLVATLSLLLLHCFYPGPRTLNAAQKPIPTHADVSYGPSPHQLMDIHLPSKGTGPFPVLIWYGGLWEPSKHVPDLNRFLPSGIAVIGVESRTLNDGMREKATAPISYPMNDACRAVQFVRHNASKWGLDPGRIAVGGGSQGSLPALYVGCVTDRADPRSIDPVERVSTRVTCVAGLSKPADHRPETDARVGAGRHLGAPALGCNFEESLKRREELRPIIETWSPEAIMHKGSAPIYFENNWGLTRPEKVTEMDYKVHSPAWALGFQKLAEEAGVVCLVKYPDHPTEVYKDIWDFLVKKLHEKAP